jgi:hypothetical protein
MKSQNKNKPFSSYQSEIIAYVKDHQGVPYTDIANDRGWSISYISTTILAYERQTGDRIGIIGDKPRKDRPGPSPMQQGVIDYVRAHMDIPLAECSRALSISLSYVSMICREYVPERHRVARKHSYAPRVPAAGNNVCERVKCLSCGRYFESPDKKNIRRCDTCKTGDDYYMETYSVAL